MRIGLLLKSFFARQPTLMLTTVANWIAVAAPVKTETKNEIMIYYFFETKFESQDSRF